MHNLSVFTKEFDGLVIVLSWFLFNMHLRGSLERESILDTFRSKVVPR